MSGDLFYRTDKGIYLGTGDVVLTYAEVSQLGNIGTTTISAAQYGYLGALDQGLATTSDVTHANFTVTGAVVKNGTTATSGAGAVAITGNIHEITTTGTGDALTLADGAEGQELFIAYVAEGAGGDTAVLTPTNFGGGSTITFNNLGDTATIKFTNATWYVIGLGGAAAVA